MGGVTYCPEDVARDLADMNEMPAAKEMSAAEARSTNKAHEAAEISRLAALDLSDYEAEREGAAEKFGWRKTTLDEAVKKQRISENDTAQAALRLESPQLWQCAVDGQYLFEELSSTIRKYVVLDSDAIVAVVLWLSFTYLYDTFDIVPRLMIRSAEKRSGKTTLGRIISRLTPRALPTSNISPAALFRVIDSGHPTILIDESDSFLRGSEAFRNLLNSGHTRDFAWVIRCEGESFESRRFSTFTPMVLAVIGRLADTIEDRSVIVQLKRKLRDESVEKLRNAPKDLFSELASKLHRWSSDNASYLASAMPDVPTELNDRAADNWLPLIAIADRVGGGWPTRARKAAIALSGADSGDASLGSTLLRDIQKVFEDEATERLSSARICDVLHQMEGHPWPEYGKLRKPISQNQLAKLLAPFGVVPSSIRIAGKTPKGYYLKDFNDAFERYLPSGNATTPQPNGDNGDSSFSERNADQPVADKDGHFAHVDKDCGGVAEDIGDDVANENRVITEVMGAAGTEELL